jgi:hypothetical protein
MAIKENERKKKRRKRSSQTCIFRQEYAMGKKI